MPLLDNIYTSCDIKKLDIKELEILASEIREEIISVTSKNGGHLSSNLGIVETTLALHYVFSFPEDKLVFDVGHQCYTHKILSERKDKFSSIRKEDGLSGFPDAEESEYDAFSTGHAGTSVSAALGLCSARDRLKQDHFVLNVVGDGSFVNGLNLEALFSSTDKPRKYILLLNDNGMSISKNKNGFYRFISKGTINKGYVRSKRVIKKIFGNSFISRWLMGFRDFIKRTFNRRNHFEQFGFKYVEIPEGNDIKKLVKTFQKVKSLSQSKAVFIHLHTLKGKGFKQAEEHADYYHGVSSQEKAKGQSFSKALGEKINALIEKEDKITAITAGMKDGTGLEIVEKVHPKNFLDVGIAEEYAVTLSAGMAKGGLKPIVCIYSTFLQRAYDEILHDVCLQKLPVIFMLDRAGLVGEDGKTHQGVFDLSYLLHIPNLTVLAPSSIEELELALDYALELNSPVAIRYPKTETENVFQSKGEISKWQTIKEGKDAIILAVGPRMLDLANQVSAELKGVGVVNARIIKPLDLEFLSKIDDQTIITLEENSVIGGFGALVNGYFSDKKNKVYNFGVKDEFVSHGTIKNQMTRNDLTKEKIINYVKNKVTLE
ncbi:MAG: 1-deoxy-D-xylulose-5-phosphate synthase [Clostridia bacterium]|nr:1-deoxy-D-xylulose-5-phosphate synthase [Clostridia bacterium]